MPIYLPLLLIWTAQTVEQPLLRLEALFLNNDHQAFGKLLSEHLRVDTDLRPLLEDRGPLGASQLKLAFRKLQRRYRIDEARITNSQSDTNYAWLEVYVELKLTAKNNGLKYTVTFAFHLKSAGDGLAISRWVLQDLS